MIHARTSQNLINTTVTGWLINNYHFVSEHQCAVWSQSIIDLQHAISAKGHRLDLISLDQNSFGGFRFTTSCLRDLCLWLFFLLFFLLTPMIFSVCWHDSSAFALSVVVRWRWILIATACQQQTDRTRQLQTFAKGKRSCLHLAASHVHTTVTQLPITADSITPQMLCLPVSSSSKVTALLGNIGMSRDPPSGW